MELIDLLRTLEENEVFTIEKTYNDNYRFQIKNWETQLTYGFEINIGPFMTSRERTEYFIKKNFEEIIRRSRG